MDGNVFFSALFAVFVFCTKPGPGYLMEIMKLLSEGPRVAISIALGAIVANSGFIWIVGLGTGLLGPSILVTALQAFCGLYLICYTVYLITWKINKLDKAQSGPRFSNAYAWFTFGLLNAFLNPINLSFYTTVLPEFTMSDQRWQTLAFLNAATVLFLITGRSLYYGFAISFKRVLFQSNAWKGIVIAANLIFLATLSVPIYNSFAALLDALLR